MSKKSNVVIAEINTLETQGKALLKQWKRIEKANAKQIVDFDLPLGKLMMSLANEAGGNIKKTRLQDCNIHNIPKQRRSDAKQLAELWDNLQDYLPRFTSTSAMLKAYKADNKPEAEAKADDVAENTEGETSDVGQAKTGLEDVPVSMTAGDIAVSVLDMLEAYNVSLDDFNKEFSAIASILKTDAAIQNKKAA